MVSNLTIRIDHTTTSTSHTSLDFTRLSTTKQMEFCTKKKNNQQSSSILKQFAGWPLSPLPPSVSNVPSEEVAVSVLGWSHYILLPIICKIKLRQSHYGPDGAQLELPWDWKQLGGLTELGRRRERREGNQVCTEYNGHCSVVCWPALNIKQSHMHHGSVRMAFTLNYMSSITPFVRSDKSSKNIPLLAVQADGCGWSVCQCWDLEMAVNNKGWTGLV